MQRTRAESSLQRSIEELEDSGAGGSSVAGGAGAPSSALSGFTAASASTSRASRLNDLANTPRGRLLQQLAAEATAAQRERGLRDARQAAPQPPSYSQVGMRLVLLLWQTRLQPALHCTGPVLLNYAP